MISGLGAVDKFLKIDNVCDYLEKFVEALEKSNPFDKQQIETNVRVLVNSLGINAGEMIHPVRVALTGGTVSPGIFEIIEFLGKEKSIARLRKVKDKLKAKDFSI